MGMYLKTFMSVINIKPENHPISSLEFLVRADVDAGVLSWRTRVPGDPAKRHCRETHTTPRNPETYSSPNSGSSNIPSSSYPLRRFDSTDHPSRAASVLVSFPCRCSSPPSSRLPHSSLCPIRAYLSLSSPGPSVTEPAVPVSWWSATRHHRTHWRVCWWYPKSLGPPRRSRCRV